MRILHVIAGMDPGGAERVLTYFAEYGRGQHELTVVSGGGPWVDRLQAHGVDHVLVPAGPGQTPPWVATARTVRRVVRSVEPDIVHTANVRVTVGAAGGVRLSGRRPAFLTTAHGTAPDQMDRAARILRLTSPVVVGCAPAVTEALETAGFPRDRLRTIDNAAALDPAPPERVAAMRGQLGLDDRPLVVGLGRLVGAKAWPVLIDAMTGLEGVDVVVAGEGALRPDLERRVAESGAPVRFVGHVDDVPALLASATCVISTSAHEGLPLALLETMSLGVPVVATAVYGETDRLGGAVLVAPGDPDAVRAEAVRMLTDDRHRAATAAAALEGAAAWTPSMMVDAYHELYDRLVSGPPGVLP
jgi:glycosyltransferase involved in cell wall biosynthesis